MANPEPKKPTAVRVGLVIGQLTVGGAEGQLRELVRHLDRRFVPTVYCLAGDGGTALAEELRGLGAIVRVVGRRGAARAWRLARMLRADGVDVVHSWLFIANAYVFGARLFGAFRPLITSARNCKVQGRASQVVNALAFRASAAIVVNSQDVADFVVRRYAAPRRRLRVVVNGIDVQRFRPAAKPPGGAGAIVTVGRMVTQKNHALFLEAAARLAALRPEQRFVLVGDGPLRPELEAQARRLGIAERVDFAGERRDVEDILRSASLFWLTSRWEGMPNVVLEALASGVPVIATDVGGTRSLIRTGVDGFVVDSDAACPDPDEFVRRSADLLADQAAWARFAAAARARAEEFSPRRMAESLGKVYEEVLERG